MAEHSVENAQATGKRMRPGSHIDAGAILPEGARRVRRATQPYVDPDHAKLLLADVSPAEYEAAVCDENVDEDSGEESDDESDDDESDEEDRAFIEKSDDEGEGEDSAYENDSEEEEDDDEDDDEDEEDDDDVCEGQDETPAATVAPVPPKAPRAAAKK